MKGWIWVLVGVVAAAAGWWWWRRRSNLPAIPDIGWGSPLQPYLQSVGSTPPGGLPPVAPTGQPAGWKDKVGSVAGTVGAVVVTTACVGAGGGPLCAFAAPVGQVVGKYGVGATITAAQYTGKGAVAVASGTKTVLKKIIPFW